MAPKYDCREEIIAVERYIDNALTGGEVEAGRLEGI